VLALLLVPSAAGASGSYDVAISGFIIAGAAFPIADMTVEVWEDDLMDDDYLGWTRTDGDGRFTWSKNGVSDQDGVTDPEIYLVAKLAGQRLILSYSDVLGSPAYAQVITGTLHPEDHMVNGHSIISLGNLYLEGEGLGPGLAYRACEQTLRQMDYRNRLRVKFDWSVPNVAEHCSNAVPYVYTLGYSPSDYHYDAIRRTLVPCLLDWIGSLSGTPPPAGGGFETVTNEGFAWDEGVKAFLEAALTNNPSAPGKSLESGISAPPSAGEAPKIAATVAASLYDLYDSNDDGRDQHDGSLMQILNVIYGRPVRSLAEFWNGWKADGLARHYPVLALWNNGVDYNTPPVWASEMVWASPGNTMPYRLDLEVSDAETPDELLAFAASLIETTDPVDWYVSGEILFATMDPPDPPGHAFFRALADDGITTSTGLVRIVWTNDAKDPPDEIDDPTRATGTRGKEGSGGSSLELKGPSVIHSVGRFEFALPVASEARLSIYDVSGRLVDIIAEGFHSAGRHEATWSAAELKGTAGVYFLELRAGEQRRWMRTVLVR
jgi:hypothetical protein